MTFSYTIEILNQRLSFVNDRINYAKHIKDYELLKKQEDKKEELEKAIEILKTNSN